MKNSTSLFVLAVEILTIILLHTMKANADANNSSKETRPARTELASKETRQSIFLSTLR